MILGETSPDAFIEVGRKVLTKAAMVSASVTLAFSVGEATLDTPVAHADTCTTTISGDTTTETCVSEDGSTVSTHTTSSSPDAAPQAGVPALPETPADTPSPNISTPAPEASAPTPSVHHSGGRKPVSRKHISPNRTHYDFNMHSNPFSPITHTGCGVISLTDAVSYELDRRVQPTSMAGQIPEFYSSAGVIQDYGSQPYMAGAAPKVAKHYHLGEHTDALSSGGAVRAIKNGGAVIMLASGGSDSIITHASHYFESDQIKDGKLVIHDPNQERGRSFDKSSRSPSWLLAHQTEDQVWVLTPQG